MVWKQKKEWSVISVGGIYFTSNMSSIRGPKIPKSLQDQHNKIYEVGGL